MTVEASAARAAKWAAEYSANGFVVARCRLDADALATARIEADRLLTGASDRGGCRNAIEKSAPLRRLASRGPLFELAREILGPESRPVKLTIFDKTPESNWKVPWHQDLTITVRERREVAGFGPWSVKDGLPHVQPPVRVLEKILAIRVHLDPTPAKNGALRLLATSHRTGRLSHRELARAVARYPVAVPELEAGDALLMSPLLVHASSAAEAPCRRRVLHYEYAAFDLPGGLRWAQGEPLQ